MADIKSLFVLDKGKVGLILVILAVLCLPLALPVQPAAQAVKAGESLFSYHSIYYELISRGLSLYVLISVLWHTVLSYSSACILLEVKRARSLGWWKKSIFMLATIIVLIILYLKTLVLYFV